MGGKGTSPFNEVRGEHPLGRGIPLGGHGLLCLLIFLKLNATHIPAAMASAMPDKEEAAESSPEVKEEEQQVGGPCEI